MCSHVIQSLWVAQLDVKAKGYSRRDKLNYFNHKHLNYVLIILL